MIGGAPLWVPFRFRRVWDHAVVVRAIRSVRQSAPTPAAAPEHADAEVHMLLCRRDLEIGVLALKSLLRFPETSWAVALSSDGSLTDGDRRWIDAHVPGCAWLPRVSSDPRIGHALRGRPRLAALYAGTYQPLRKLLHPAVLARHRRVIVLDPDTAFWSVPTRLVEWARRDGAPGLFLQDWQDEQARAPREFWTAFEELRARVAPDGGSWCLPHAFFNSGLLAYEPSAVDLDLAETYLEWLEAAPPHFKEGKPGLWFGAWTPEQTIYQLIFARMTPSPESLGPAYRIGHKRAEIFNHFLWLQLTMPVSLGMLRELAAGLPRAGR